MTQTKDTRKARQRETEKCESGSDNISGGGDLQDWNGAEGSVEYGRLDGFEREREGHGKWQREDAGQWRGEDGGGQHEFDEFAGELALGMSSGLDAIVWHERGEQDESR